MARRPLALACIFLVAAQMPSAFGQATLLEGLQDGDSINLDTMIDELAEQDVVKASYCCVTLSMCLVSFRKLCSTPLHATRFIGDREYRHLHFEKYPDLYVQQPNP